MMALADQRAGAQALIPGTTPTILCCMCGTPMVWNQASMCANCIRTRVDITEGIPKSVPMQHCRACGRFLNPPKQWVACQPESKELLTICLKRIKGLNKVKLIDASFIWTEAHSKRLKVKLTIQKEVYSGVILQQVFVVELVIHNFQCTNCHMVAADNTWRAVVQCRQKVDHKRTFYLLEQLILKYKAHTQTVSVKEVPDGIDFYFLHRNHALKFQDFAMSVVPCRSKGASERIISEDLNNNRLNAKYTFSLEIVPVCKDDIMCLAPRQHSSLGNLGPLVLVSGVTQCLKLIDPMTMQRGELRQEIYYKNPRMALMTLKQATEYTVLDSELTGLSAGRMQQAEVTIARTRDLGSNDERFTTKTHLGSLLQAGDTVLGYDFTAAVFNDAETKEWPNLQLPDVVLVKKVYPENRRRRRMWKLRALIKEEEEGLYKSRHKNQDQDYEHFLEDVDMDAEVRQRVNIYKDPAHFKVTPEGQILAPSKANRTAAVMEEEEPAEEEEEEVNQDLINLEEMLDDLVLGEEDEEEAVGGDLGYDSEGSEGGGGASGSGPMKKGKKPARQGPY